MLKIVCFLYFCYFQGLAFGIQINYIKVPSAVKNNSGVPAILDCNYSIRPDDSDLVVKWFLNGEVVYQWIPPQKPQSLGILKNRVDLSFKAADDPKTVFRGMKIRNPTTDVAGEYKCSVSTFADEDFSAKNMIVFEPEQTLVILKDKPSRNSINFTCFASQVYPAPKLILYQDKKDDLHNKNPLQTWEWNTSKHPNGRFSVFIVANALLNLLNSGSLIHCELRIPGTGYVKRRSLLYFPADIQKGCGQPNYMSCIAIILFALFINFIISQG